MDQVTYTATPRLRPSSQIPAEAVRFPTVVLLSELGCCSEELCKESFKLISNVLWILFGVISAFGRKLTFWA